MHQKQRKFSFRTAFVTAMGLYAFEASASGTITYSYDALGRLVTMDMPASVQSTYKYDDAGNRYEQKVTGSPNPPPPPQAVVVVPLNGFTIIPIE